MVTTLRCHGMSENLNSESIRFRVGQLKNLCRSRKVEASFTQLDAVVQETTYKIKQARDIYPLYLEAKTFIKNNSGNSAILEKYKKILRSMNGMWVQRIGLPPLILDFNPLLKKESYNYETLNFQNRSMVEVAAMEIDQLCEEGIGYSFGKDALRRILSSPDSLCITVSTQGKIVGFAMGTCLTIRNQKVFHIWFAARSANHPEMNLVQSLSEFKQLVITRFDANYLSLGVEVDYAAAIELYKKAGFGEASRNESKVFMLQLIKENYDSAPTSAEVGLALKNQSGEMLGVLSKIRAFASFHITKVFRKYWYQ